MNFASAKGIFTETIVIVNSFVHDLTTGVWIGCLVVMQAVLAEAHRFQASIVQQFADSVLKGLMNLSLISVAVMFLTGGVRVFTLKHYGWSGDIARGRKRLLIVKHIILGVFVVVGLIMQIRLYLSM